VLIRPNVLLSKNSVIPRPVQEFNFDSNALSSLINFSRTSNATVTNSAGVITYAPHNLLTYSEQFDNAAWTKTTTTITANSLASPDGNTTVDTLTAGGANSTVLHSYTAIAQSYVFSVWLRRKTGTGNIDITADGTTYVTKAITTSWVRYETAIVPTAGTRTPGIRIATNGDEVYAFGAQLEIGTTATTYNSTTVKNLLGYSELFDNAAWTKSNSFVQTNLLTYSEDFTVAGWAKTTITPVANSTTAPNGYATADTLPAAGANSTALQTYTAANVAYTFSVWLKRKTGTGNIDITVDGTTYVTKTIITDWVRYDTTLTPSAGSKTAGIRIATNGDEVYAWGAQLVQGSTAGDYRRTDAAALPIYYANHNGVVCAEQIHASAGNGTVLESFTATGGSMTMSVWLRRITGTGNVDLTLDSGSTYTTQTITSSWARYSVTGSPTAGAKTAGIRLVTSGDVVQVFGAMVSDSASLDPYALNAAAAPTAAAYYGARFDYDPVTLQPKGLLIEEQRSNLLLNSTIDGANLATQNVTVTAQAYTLSFYGTGQIVLSGTASATVTGTGAYPTRKTLTFTPTAGTLTLTVTGTVQYAQLEAGSFATSYIPTGASQVTRTADVATIQGSNFYGFYNQNEGSIVTNSNPLALGTYRVININDGTGNNRILMSTLNASGQYLIQVGGVSQVDLTVSGGYTANTYSKQAIAYKIDNFANVINSSTVLTDTSGATPLVNILSLSSMNGTIKQISYYNTRLADATLKGLTA